MKIAFIMDPIEDIIVDHDSSFGMMLEVQRRGWNLYYLQSGDLFWQNGEAAARAQRLNVWNDEKKWFEVLEETTMSLGNFDMVIMRKDPPFDMSYIYATYFLDHAVAAGVLVVNHPQSLRDANEKFFATQFPQCMAPTIISSQLKLLNAFRQAQGEVIVKPLDGMGGRGIFKASAQEDITLKLLEITHDQRTPIMMQRFLPEVKQGDKRILLVNGEPISHALLRVPQGDSILANLAAGGRGELAKLTERDLWICQQVGPALRKMGLYFVGLDVIGDYLTEINVTSPTGMRELDRWLNINISEQLFNILEKKLKK